MEYEVMDTQHQTYGSPRGKREVVVFTVEYTDGDYKNTAYLEFEEDDPGEKILAGIAAHGKSLLPKSQKGYNFAKSGVIK